ncbi:MAG: cyclic nucleotide-binding domain-containing protein [Candidatus Velamenicoccus archaeovorus]
MSVRVEGVWAAVERRLDAAGQAGTELDLWDALDRRVDPSTFRPKLADDIEIREFPLRWGGSYVMVANPRDLLHYRLRASDRRLLELMDGTRTVKEIVLQEFEESGDLDVSAVSDLVRLLYEGNFLAVRYQDVDELVGRALDPVTERRRKARGFVRTLSIEWKDADRLIRWLYRHGLKVFFRRWVAVPSVILAVTGFAAFLSLAGSDRFTLTGQSLAIGAIVLLILDYVMVFVHEVGHALVIAHNGRHIRSAGFQIYFGSPAFFVDSSDGMMMDRHQQILESFAGPYAQILVAAASSLVAWAVPGWILSETLYRYAVLNYVVVMMNLIPMLELDGYYILADLIEVPDLRQRSLTFMRHDMVRKLLGRERLSKQEVGLGVYGVLGVAFTVFSFYTAYFYWRTVFGGLVSRLWNEGSVARLLLIVLAVFIANPVLRGAVQLVRSLLRRVRALVRRIRFQLERGWRVEAAEAIDELPMFDEVPVELLNDLAGRVRLRTLSAGEPVFRQGDRPEAFYVVRRGALEVVEEDPGSGTERQIRLLGPGESFGELALATGAPRTATVRSIAESELFEVDRGTFERLLADRLRLPTFAPTVQELSELRAQPCFANLGSAELARLREQGEWRTYAPGEDIVQQGDVGDAFYAISSGQVHVVENGEFRQTLGQGSYFGEIALLLDVPRTATVTARTPVRAFRLERSGFDNLLAASFRRGVLDPSVPVNQTLTH